MRSLLSETRTIQSIADGADLWMLDLESVVVAQLDCDLLDAGERDRAVRLEREADRLGFIAAHQLLRELLGIALNCRPRAIVYGREPCPACGKANGRPVVRAPSDRTQFSLSRTDGLVLIGIAQIPIGVDVQRIASAQDVVTLLHPDERGEVESAPLKRRDEVFTQLWVRKEAHLKAIGTGLAHGLDHECLSHHSRAAGPSDSSLFDVSVPSGFCAAVSLGLSELR